MSTPHARYTEIGSIRREVGDTDSFGVINTALRACTRCGAVVSDTDAHDRFHRALDVVVYVPGPGFLMPTPHTEKRD